VSHKTLVFHQDARQLLLNGVNALAEAVKVTGGGVALLRARRVLEHHGETQPQKFRARIVYDALAAPLRQIAQNAGADAEAVVHAVAGAADAFGYDAANGDYGDMIERGIVDPVKVARTALQNAISVASLLLTTDCMIVRPSKERTDGFRHSDWRREFA